METVTLKSRVGPTRLRTGNPLAMDRRPDWVVHFNFENDFRATVPAEWWETIKDRVFDDKAGLLYHDAFKPL